VRTHVGEHADDTLLVAHHHDAEQAVVVWRGHFAGAVVAGVRHVGGTPHAQPLAGEDTLPLQLQHRRVGVRRRRQRDCLVAWQLRVPCELFEEFVTDTGAHRVEASDERRSHSSGEPSDVGDVDDVAGGGGRAFASARR
jgi:hypothetical protein